MAEPIKKLVGPPSHVITIWVARGQLHDRTDTLTLLIRLNVLSVNSLLHGLPTDILARSVAFEKSRRMLPAFLSYTKSALTRVGARMFRTFTVRSVVLSRALPPASASAFNVSRNV
jgi:hypothetical protein